MDKKTGPIYMLPPREPPQIERYAHTKRKGIEKDISCKQKGEKAGVAILISNKIYFKTKAIVRDKGGHYIMIKGTIQQEDMTLVNIYTLNIGASKYIKQILTVIKREINRNNHSRRF